MTVNVLGVAYAIEYIKKTQDSYLEQADGYCDTSIKRIVVRDYTEDERKEPGALGNMDVYKKKVARHELVHAFLYESGMSVNTNSADSWATNEEMVDWLAIQGPKLFDAWKNADVI